MLNTIANLATTLPAWFPRSTVGLSLAIVYALIAIVVVKLDRKETSGGWITLHGMGAFLITFRVSFVGEVIGMKPDYRSNIEVGFAVLVCAALVYLVGAAIGWATAAVMQSGATP